MSVRITHDGTPPASAAVCGSGLRSSTAGAVCAVTVERLGELGRIPVPFDPTAVEPSEDDLRFAPRDVNERIEIEMLSVTIPPLRFASVT